MWWCYCLFGSRGRCPSDAEVQLEVDLGRPRRADFVGMDPEGRLSIRRLDCKCDFLQAKNCWCRMLFLFTIVHALRCVVRQWSSPRCQVRNGLHTHDGRRAVAHGDYLATL